MEKQFVQKVYSPIGEIIVVADENTVISIEFVNKDLILEKENNTNDITELASKQLEEYFSGQRKEFDLPLRAENSTEFREKVWGGLVKIPYGETRSYLQLAESTGDKNASRAVGNANGQNPIAIVVPCHRVIGADGSLHGYASGVWRKKWLLEHEQKNNKL